jgi:hypothetical protein
MCGLPRILNSCLHCWLFFSAQVLAVQICVLLKFAMHHANDVNCCCECCWVRLLPGGLMVSVGCLERIFAIETVVLEACALQ